MSSPKTPRRIPTQARAQATVNAILDATEQLASERGVEAVSMRDIAQRAGVSPGTLYQYFGTLEATLAAWEERGFEQEAVVFMNAVGAVVAKKPPVEEGVAELAGLGFDMMLRRMRYYRDRSRAELVSRTAGRLGLADAFIGPLSAALAAGREPHRWRRTDHRMASRVALVTIMAVAYDTWTQSLDEEGVARVRAEVAALLAAYLVKDAVPSPS